MTICLCFQGYSSRRKTPASIKNRRSVVNTNEEENMELALVSSNQINVSSHQNDNVSESNITKRRHVAHKTSGNINIFKHFPFFEDTDSP